MSEEIAAQTVILLTLSESSPNSFTRECIVSDISLYSMTPFNPLGRDTNTLCSEMLRT